MRAQQACDRPTWVRKSQSRNVLEQTSNQKRFIPQLTKKGPDFRVGALRPNKRNCKYVSTRILALDLQAPKSLYVARKRLCKTYQGHHPGGSYQKRQCGLAASRPWFENKQVWTKHLSCNWRARAWNTSACCRKIFCWRNDCCCASCILLNM